MFLPVPYHTDTSLLALASQIVPLARAARSINVDVPVLYNEAEPAESMVVDQLHGPVLSTRKAEICADGLLLYVAEASYEAGTSPLSSWIPITKYEEDGIADGMADSNPPMDDGPLDVFNRSPPTYFFPYYPNSHVMFLDWFRSESRATRVVNVIHRWVQIPWMLRICNSGPP
jgi:hypothetical protein